PAALAGARRRPVRARGADDGPARRAGRGRGLRRRPQPRAGGGTGMSMRATTLPGGLRVVTDAMPDVQTASVGTWVGAGTRNERAEVNGIAHLAEHMVFKGTRRRTAFQISEQIEAVGGHMNAYTTREHTA